ncbi:MAG TPA: cytochrome c peroxidase [Lacipirellula sp.]
MRQTSGLFRFAIAAALAAACGGARAQAVVEEGARASAEEERVESNGAGREEAKPEVVVRGRAGTFSRLPPRPERSEEERAKRAAELRAIFHQPPETWPAPTVDEGVPWEEIGLLPDMKHPADNPHSPAKEELGELLFFDPRLSGSRQMACASCHDADLGWADGRTTSFGMDRKPLARNAPSVMNVGYHKAFFWDGRAKTLEEQAFHVLMNHDEMRSAADDMAETLGAIPRYRELFEEGFGSEEVTIERVTKALACFERTIVGGRSRFDAFLKGRDQAMSDSAVLGMEIFRNEGRCMNCHHGPLLSDSEFHDVGLSYYGRKYEDLGRYEVTKKPEDVGKFRTPSLRNFQHSGPYMHNGLFASGRGVLNMYNAGMPTLVPKEEQEGDPLFPKTKSRHLRPLGLNGQDLADLEAFLEAASEPYLRHRPPELPRAGERVEEATAAVR